VILGAAFVLRQCAETPAARLRELGYVLLAAHVALHGALIPEPRFLVPLRPLLFVLALAALADVATRLTAQVTAAVVGVVASIAAAGWASAAFAAHRAPAARRAAATELASGRRLEAAGDLSGALAAYEAARAAEPRNVDAAMLAGLLYHHRLGDPARAVACYRDVLQARPDHYGAHYQLATALLAAGRTAEARAAWAGFVRLAEAIGDSASIARAPPTLRESSGSR
jgi:tetratricopeptide (TPR) repeat protein